MVKDYEDEPLSPSTEDLLPPDMEHTSPFKNKGFYSNHDKINGTDWRGAPFSNLKTPHKLQYSPTLRDEKGKFCTMKRDGH